MTCPLRLAIAFSVLLAACQATPSAGNGKAPTEGRPNDDVIRTEAPSAQELAPTVPPGQHAAPGPSTRTMAVSIHISLEETQFQCGHPIPLRVEFRNDGATATTFRQPERTWELALVVGAPGTEPAPFGKTFVSNYGGVFRRSIEDADEITLAPGETYAFVEDVGTRWPHLFPPGARQLYLIDRRDSGEVVSNTVSAQILFAEEALPKLFELLERKLPDPHAPTKSSEEALVVTIRQFAADWIGKLVPGFQLDVTPSDAAAEARYQSSLAEARSYWEQHRGSPSVLAKIQEINRQAQGF